MNDDNLRTQLCASANIKFQRMTQRDDLMTDRTQQTLIRALWAITRGFPIMITACVTDHSDDTALGKHCHHNGYCVDCWPIYVPRGSDWSYYDPASMDFRIFLRYVSNAPFVREIGLAGSAWSNQNMTAALLCKDVFHDDGEEHIHIGVGDMGE